MPARVCGTCGHENRIGVESGIAQVRPWLGVPLRAPPGESGGEDLSLEDHVRGVHSDRKVCSYLRTRRRLRFVGQGDKDHFWLCWRLRTAVRFPVAGLWNPDCVALGAAKQMSVLNNFPIEYSTSCL